MKKLNAYISENIKCINDLEKYFFDLNKNK